MFHFLYICSIIKNILSSCILKHTRRSFNCLRIGDQGVKIVKPEDGGGIHQKPGIDADIDAGGNDDIEDYDENLVRRITGGLI